MAINAITFDPGQRNFAYAVTRHRLNPMTGEPESRVVECGHMHKVLTDLKGRVGGQLWDFKAELGEIEARLGPFDLVGAERFMARGVLAGTMGETVNIMIGVMGERLARDGLDWPELVAANTWKTAYNKEVKAYSEGLRSDYSLSATTPHALDASLIGVYLGSQSMRTNPFRTFRDELVRDAFWLDVETACRVPLTRRRARRSYHNLEWE